MYNRTHVVGIILTELVSGYPLVTENSEENQFSCLAEELKWGADDLVDFSEKCRNSGIIRNFEQRSSSKSYAVANTATDLRKLFPMWTRSMLDIVSNCLQLNPVNRKNATQLLNMKFFTQENFALKFDKLLESKIKQDNLM